MAHGKEILKNYAAELKGDDHLFWILDLDLGNEARPHLVIGEQAEGFCYNAIRGGANLDIRYHAPNSGSRANKRAEAIGEIREDMKKHFGDFDQPMTIADELEQAKAKIAAFEAEKAANVESKPKKGGSE